MVLTEEYCFLFDVVDFVMEPPPTSFHIFPGQQSQDRTSVQLATGQDVKDAVPLALRLILLPEGEPPNKPDGSPGLRDVKR